MKKSGIYTDGHWGPQLKDFKYGGATIRCNPRKKIVPRNIYSPIVDVFWGLMLPVASFCLKIGKRTMSLQRTQWRLSENGKIVFPLGNDCESQMIRCRKSHRDEGVSFWRGKKIF